MNQRIIAFIPCLVLVLARSIAAQPAPRPDSLAEAMFPPELLLRNQEQLGLSDDQVQWIRGQIEQTQRKFMELQQNQRKEMATLGELLKQERPDAEKALAQLDKVLDVEREIRRSRLALSLELHGKLTPEQWAKACELRRQFEQEMRNRPQPPESFREKMEQTHLRLQKAREGDRDLSSIGPLMQELQPLIEAGKFKEAEEMLDEIGKALNEVERR